MAAKREVKVVFIGDSKNLDRALAKMSHDAETHSRKMQEAFKGMGKGMMLAGGTILAGVGVAAKAFEDQQKANLKLENTLQNMPKLAGQTTKAFYDQATALQKVTAVGDDQIITAQAMLGTFNLTGEEIRGIIPLVTDYSRKFGVDMVSASIQVGKALDGQIGALRRNGVTIDETLFKTDRYAAVQKALSEQVGGFAEAEGKTFSGQLEILKNQLGEIAEGVGAGAVDAFSNLLGPVTAISDRFQQLTPESQAFVGQMATMAGGALVLGGSVLYGVGKFLEMRKRMSELATEFPKLSTGLGLLGGALTAVAFVYTLKQWSDSVDGLKADFHDLAGAATDELLVSMQQLIAIGQADDNWLTGLSGQTHVAEEFFQGLADESEGAAIRLRDAMAAAGMDVTAFDAILAELDRTQAQTAADSDLAAAATGELGDATEEATKSYDDLTGAVDKARDAIRKQFDEITSGLDASVEWEQSLDDMTAKLGENAHGFDINSQSGRDNWQALQDVQQALIDVGIAELEHGASAEEAAAKVNANVDTLRGQLQMLGYTNDEIDTQLFLLGLLPDQTTTYFNTPGLAQANTDLATYQARLSAVSTIGTVTTQVILSAFGGPGRATGGPVMPGEAYTVGEHGPEQLVMGAMGGYINPNPADIGGGGGGTTNVTINVSTNDPQAVVDTLRRYMQTHGAVPIRVNG